MNLKKIEKFINKQTVSFICSVDEEGYPNVKAMLKPRISIVSGEGANVQPRGIDTLPLCLCGDT